LCKNCVRLRPYKLDSRRAAAAAGPVMTLSIAPIQNAASFTAC
jgi:hypothetical protein